MAFGCKLMIAAANYVHFGRSILGVASEWSVRAIEIDNKIKPFIGHFKVRK